MKLEIFFDHKVWSAETAVFIVLTDQNGKRMLAKPMELVFEPLDLDHGKLAEPSLNFSPEFGMQFFPALVDGLARAGYKYESSDTGELKATKVHLDDMRKLVLK